MRHNARGSPGTTNPREMNTYNSGNTGGGHVNKTMASGVKVIDTDGGFIALG